MGKVPDQQQLATPPGSTRLEAQLPDFLPDLSLPPAQISLSPVAEKPQRRSAALASRKRTWTHTADEEESEDSLEARVESQSQYAGTSTPAPAHTSRKRSAKPSRKTTHSQIEKRRREKINDTMTRLKQLVPACHAHGAESLRKLDVLTETAAYIDALHAQIAQLQGHTQQRASRGVSRESSFASETPSVVAFQAFTQPAPSLSPPSVVNHTTSPFVGETTLDESALTAAESLVQISESPMLGPVKRMSIAELMHI
ncbi:hypothetical protein BCR37DRAFT_395765 [Protomyces lactucae-debilis]|uniref:BHLH domain-containing protein n=1 Tax=Protomyces lactucae-debilis TaxID=2754530 RepID=A0A1Y2ESQ5_PROLT|nr:uncharacterized protein BCR37DRAFT_395765 [Protomyces lactucae-debilis]ORY74611.1 hypothetical protein BCR37DRAFT_395765 [Protomyces lactucae-debilis]